MLIPWNPLIPSKMTGMPTAFVEVDVPAAFVMEASAKAMIFPVVEVATIVPPDPLCMNSKWPAVEVDAMAQPPIDNGDELLERSE